MIKELLGFQCFVGDGACSFLLDYCSFLCPYWESVLYKGPSKVSVVFILCISDSLSVESNIIIGLSLSGYMWRWFKEDDLKGMK